MHANSLANRTALVTGASRGLGAAIALELAARGAAVAINYHAKKERAEAIADQIKKAGGRAAAFQGDVRDEKQIGRLIQQISSVLAPIDILVVNATGDQPMLSIEQLTWQLCLDQLEFFVKSPLLLAQAVLPHMKSQRWGRIVHIGSEVFEMAVPRFSQYVAAKGAQLGLARSWSRELAPFNITVNLVAPGWIPTERHSDSPEADKQAYAQKVPLQRLGRAEEIAAAVAYLASDDAAFVTGQKISVNGGNTVE